MALPDRPRRKYAPRLPREQRRAQLLDAALEVLDRCPLHELSMEAVAEHAGVGKPVLYTAFRTRTELVTELLKREHERGLAQVGAAIRTDLAAGGPTAAYAATVSAFLQSVLENPTRWRLILTVPESVPRDYRDSLRTARSLILTQVEDLARAGAMLQPRLSRLEPELLAHSMLSIAEMLGRLAVNNPERYSRERLESFADGMMALIAGKH